MEKYRVNSDGSMTYKGFEIVRDVLEGYPGVDDGTVEYGVDEGDRFLFFATLEECIEHIDSGEAYGVTYATAVYTGGGVYVYNGRLNNGKYFLTADDADTMLTTDTDPESCYEEVWYTEWQEAHCEELDIRAELWNEMLLWIIDNRPTGNYQQEELKARFR